MKFTRKILAGALSAAAMAAAPLAVAELDASVGVASSYLWRGYDLGSGTPAVSGSLSYSAEGFYSGIWGSSGDALFGTEYDLYAGYGTSFVDDLISVDLSIWNYNYPTGPGASAALNRDDDIRLWEDEVREGEFGTDFGELSEVVLSIGVGPVAFTYFDNVAGGTGYEYYTLSGSFGSFALTLGMHDFAQSEADDPVHINLDYSYNDNLVFTLSQFVEDQPAGDDMKFVVSYSLPIGE